MQFTDINTFDYQFPCNPVWWPTRLVLWKSNKERHNSRNSQESEVKSTDQCTKGAQYLWNILGNLDIITVAPTKIYEDNQAVFTCSEGVS